jgi:hypothetical protein
MHQFCHEIDFILQVLYPRFRKSPFCQPEETKYTLTSQTMARLRKNGLYGKFIIGDDQWTIPAGYWYHSTNNRNLSFCAL